MEATIKKEIEVTLKLSGEEAVLLREFFGELSVVSIKSILTREFCQEDISKKIFSLTDSIYTEFVKFKL